MALVALRLEPADLAPDLDALSQALAFPSRPLFLGRKPCAPAVPILAGACDAASVPDALQAGIALLAGRSKEVPTVLRPEIDGGTFAARWPIEEGGHERGSVIDVFEERDFPNDVHAGWRRRVVASLPAPDVEAGR